MLIILFNNKFYAWIIIVSNIIIITIKLHIKSIVVVVVVVVVDVVRANRDNSGRET